jgi:hypothetical protein
VNLDKYFVMASRMIQKVHGQDGWRLSKTNDFFAVQVIARVPDWGELDREIPRQRNPLSKVVDVDGPRPEPGDLVSFQDRADAWQCYLLTDNPEPDAIGYTHRMIATPFRPRGFDVSFAADGKPNLAWNGQSWVPTV